LLKQRDLIKRFGTYEYKGDIIDTICVKDSDYYCNACKKNFKTSIISNIDAHIHSEEHQKKNLSNVLIDENLSNVQDYSLWNVSRDCTNEKKIKLIS